MADKRVQIIIAAKNQANKAFKEIRRDMNNLGLEAKQLGQLAAAATTLVAASVGAMVVSTTNAAGEISRSAAISNAGVEEFQRWGKAADFVGISQEKLADQLKDFNEKLGEFQQTGGGGMKDFFEQIAPQIGITADAFKGLSGPESLQLYYDSLEKANLSQEQMSFYLESMASDTTALIPLLRNGGEAFKTIGDAAEEAGAIIRSDTISSANELAAGMMLAKMSMDGVKTQIASELIPTFADLSNAFAEASVSGAASASVGDILATSLKLVAETAVGAAAAVHLTGKSIAALMAATAAATQDSKWYDALLPIAAMNRMRKNAAEIKNQLEIAGGDLGETIDGYAALMDKIWSAGSGESDTPDRIKQIAGILAEMKRTVKAGGGASPDEDQQKAVAKVDALINGLLSEPEKLKAELDKRLKMIQGALTAGHIDDEKAKQARLLLEADYQAKLAELEQQGLDALKERREAARAARENEINAALAQINLGERQRTIGRDDAARQRLDLQRELLALQEQHLAQLDKLEDPDGWYAQLDAVNATREALVDLEDELQRLTGTLTEGAQRGLRDWLDETRTTFEDGQKLARDAAEGMNGAFEEALFDAQRNQLQSLSDYWDLFLVSIQRSVAQVLSQKLTESIASLFDKGKQDNSAANIEETATTTALTAAISAQTASVTALSAAYWALAAAKAAAGVAGAGAGTGTGGGGSVVPSAKGNVFSAGQVVPFAKGTVISSPTYFPMVNGNVGLMGEAGEEAIMPLERGADGRLGVVARGGGGGNIGSMIQQMMESARPVVQMTVVTRDAESFKAPRSQAQILAKYSRGLERASRRNN